MMCSTDSSDSTWVTNDPAPAVLPDEAVQAASDCLAGEVGSSLVETAARLRRAMQAGTLPTNAAARMIARLEELAAKVSEGPTSPQE
jgi:hypothetical protein